MLPSCWLLLPSTLLNDSLNAGSLRIHLPLLKSVMLCKACNTCCSGADAPVSSSRMRVAAATALGAAAVKAKMLADAEEREVQRQVQVAVDAQIQKVQLKLNSITQLEDALEKERSIMEVFDTVPHLLHHAYRIHIAQCNNLAITDITHLCPVSCKDCFWADCMLTSGMKVIWQLYADTCLELTVILYSIAELRVYYS